MNASAFCLLQWIVEDTFTRNRKYIDIYFVFCSFNCIFAEVMACDSDIPTGSSPCVEMVI